MHSEQAVLFICQNVEVNILKCNKRMYNIYEIEGIIFATFICAMNYNVQLISYPISN